MKSQSTYYKATLTRCEPSLGGYTIRWRAPNSLTWQATLARIKQLPVNLRDYVVAERSWWIDAAVVGRISDCFENYSTAMGCDPADYDIGYDALYQRGRFKPQVPPDVVEAFKVLHLQTDAPADLVKAAQRVLARQCHPDVGGDHLQMVRINLSAERALGWAERQHAA